MTGPLWTSMNAQPRRHAAELRKHELPDEPGVYAWYRDGDAIYVGKADSLKDRLARHLGRGRVMTSSAFRRNVAEHLGISTATLIKSRRTSPTTNKWPPSEPSSSSAKWHGSSPKRRAPRSSWRCG
jgi:hypothetical protein